MLDRYTIVSTIEDRGGGYSFSSSHFFAEDATGDVIYELRVTEERHVIGVYPSHDSRWTNPFP